jgi:hypothetical protein
MRKCIPPPFRGLNPPRRTGTESLGDRGALPARPNAVQLDQMRPSRRQAAEDALHLLNLRNS